MLSKELKKLGRRELVDIIYQLKKNEEELRAELSSLKNELNEKRIKLSQTGSVAEAAASITNVFSAAQQTADLYLNEITQIKKETEAECAAMVDAAKKKVETILLEGQKQYNALNERYKADYQKWQQLKSEIQKLKE